MVKQFVNRKQAGIELALKLEKYRGAKPIILALPRGGVPVGFEIAKALHAPLDVIISRKLSMPSNKEFGVGSICEDGSPVLDEKTLSLFGLSKEGLSEIIKEEKTEIDRRIMAYRKTRPLTNIKGKTVILVDDGLATGVTARAAIESVKKKGAAKIIFASPVCALSSAKELADVVDEVVCAVAPVELHAVGFWYEDFPQLSDKEVIEILDSLS